MAAEPAFFLALICFSLACGAPAAAQTGDAGCRDIAAPRRLDDGQRDRDLAIATMIDAFRSFSTARPLERAVAPPTGCSSMRMMRASGARPSSPQLDAGTASRTRIAGHQSDLPQRIGR